LLIDYVDIGKLVMWFARKRDSQRQKVYDSEVIFNTKTKENFLEIYEKAIKKMTLDEIEEYCLKLIDLKWFQKRWPQVKGVNLGDGRSRRSACAVLNGKEAKMTFPVYTRYKIMVLHELSHACDMSNAGWHGRPFCRIYLELIRHELGDAAWRVMKECFKQKKVKVRVETLRPDLKGKTPLGFDKMMEAKSKK